MRFNALHIWVLAVFLLVVGNLSAQGGNNPFDIRRAPVEEGLAEEVPLLGNPFDIRTPPMSQAPAPRPVAGTRPVEEIAPEERASGRFRFALVLIILLLLTVCFSLFRGVIQKAYRSFFNDNFLNQVHREQTGIIHWPYLFLYGIFFLQMGIFIFLAGLERGWFPDADHWRMSLRIVGMVTALIILKHIVLKLIGTIYPVEKESGEYSFLLVVFGIIAGFVLIPFNLLLAYGPENLRDGLVWGGLGVLALLLLYRSARGIFLGARLLAAHFFHFLLYICTVEIAPVVWLVTLLQDRIS